MKGKILLAVIAVWLPAEGGHGGYLEMMNNLQGYRPPEYFQRQLQESEGKPTVQKDARDEDMGRALAAAEKEFTSAAARWREALALQRDEELFFKPDARLWKRLEGAKTQPQAAADALSGRFSADTLATLVLLR
ncbi:MAG: hypothetical protein C4530_07215, partial [Desulfobacteraceae bacterium]